MQSIEGQGRVVKFAEGGCHLINFRYIIRKAVGLVGMIRKKIRWVAVWDVIQIEEVMLGDDTTRIDISASAKSDIENYVQDCTICDYYGNCVYDCGLR